MGDQKKTMSAPPSPPPPNSISSSSPFFFWSRQPAGQCWHQWFALELAAMRAVLLELADGSEHRVKWFDNPSSEEARAAPGDEEGGERDLDDRVVWQDLI